jgi:hypothetical protein
MTDLRKLAEAATPGLTLEYEEQYAEDGCYDTENGCPGHATGMADVWPRWNEADGDPRHCEEPGEMRIEDAAYLAACSPEVVIRLLDVVDAARRIWKPFDEETGLPVVNKMMTLGRALAALDALGEA